MPGKGVPCEHVCCEFLSRPRFVSDRADDRIGAAVFAIA
jgi:hypothetical protein